MVERREKGGYLLESNVFSIESFDEILFTIDDFDGSTRLPFSNIASLEPSIRSKRFFRLLITIIVSLRDTWSTQPDFTLRRFIIREISRICDVD